MYRPCRCHLPFSHKDLIFPVCVNKSPKKCNERRAQFCVFLQQQHFPQACCGNLSQHWGKRQLSILPLVRVVQVCPHFSTNPKWCILHVRRYITRVMGYPAVVLSPAKFRRGAILISRLIFINCPISIDIASDWELVGLGTPCGQFFPLVLRTSL